MNARPRQPHRRLHSPAAILAIAAGATGAPAQEPLVERVQQALERTRPCLMAELAGAQHDHLGLLCLAALHDQVPFDDPRLQRALGKLCRQSLGGTYQLAVRLTVLADLPASYPGRRQLADNDLRLLLGNYLDGGFGYHAVQVPGTSEARPDMSNTQYGALGLRAAAAIGCQVAESHWRRLLADVLGHQATDGGFDYRSGTTTPYPSMTVAGITVLEVCLQQLPADHVLVTPARRAIDRAWRWMDHHADAVGDPTAHACYYFHYGLERAAVLSGRDAVGGRPWYRTGAEMLLGMMLPRGGWEGRLGYVRGDHTQRPEGVSTGFAVLFLRREFRADPRAPLPRTWTGIGDLQPQATIEEIRRVANRAIALGTAAMPEVLAALDSPSLAQRKAALLALVPITGQGFGYHPYYVATRRAAAVAAARQWWREHH